MVLLCVCVCVWVLGLVVVVDSVKGLIKVALQWTMGPIAGRLLLVYACIYLLCITRGTMWAWKLF